MITGSDSVLIVAGREVRVVIRDFLDLMWRRWPDMLIAIDAPGGDFPVFASWDELRHGNLDVAADVLVCRDSGMVASWDELGYALGSDGEGPFAVMYEPLRVASLTCELREDPYLRGGELFEPYEVLLVAPGGSLLTLVTPDDDSAFSSAIRDLIISCVHG